MDERRFRRALEEVSKTIHSFGEEEIFAALGVIAERFDWELVKRDPGPPEENEEFWSDPECSDPRCACHRIGRHPRLVESDADLLERAFKVRPINMTGRIL